ncbi:MAG: patatin-like phospholipase family protein [Rubripirellula sp.]
MSRIGLALSGGGFRATLYHLGVLRFLRDANRLQDVSHMTSVSGGSIMAAHLLLNWDRYNGTDEEFEQAAEELLTFVRMDVRNRVVRRFPLAFLGNCTGRLFGRGWSRKLTRPGLLEAHYEKFLFGDKCLYEMPAVPQLHILATNVNEGCLCSFTRNGLILQRRMAGGEQLFELVPSGIATVPMAVTASSAFPGFFPPLQLTAKDVGVGESRFPPHLFTDGGVYDNLGVRMFRNIEDSWISHDTPIRAADFVDIHNAKATFQTAPTKIENEALSKLAELLHKNAGDADHSLTTESLPESVWSIIVHEDLYLEPAFAELANEEKAADLFHIASRGRKLEQGDHLWLNRFLVNACYRQATGMDMLKSVQLQFDAVIVSDAGKQFTVSRRTKGGGLMGTAIRASDILMNRVWELENDHFQSESDFVFAPMSLTVQPAEDPTALHPEIQHQVTGTRTDLDQFSELEISGLVRHGYCVMRKVCRSRPDLFGDDLPTQAPWDPTAIAGTKSQVGPKEANLITAQTRELQESSQRKILGRLLSWRDWPSYLFVPLLLLLFVGVPYTAYQRYKVVHQSEMIVDAITFSNPDFQLVLQLARQNPIPGVWKPLAAEEVPELKPVDMTGFRLVTDTRILDFRAWQPDATSIEHQMVGYRRMLVRRESEATTADGAVSDNQGYFRIQQFSVVPDVTIRSSSSELNPILRVAPATSPAGKEGFMFEAGFDLSSVPTGEDFDVGFEVSSTGIQGREDSNRRLSFPIIAPTDVATMWVLLPQGASYSNLQLVMFDKSKPNLVESVEPTYRFDMDDGSLFGWMVVAPRDNHTYECTWNLSER